MTIVVFDLDGTLADNTHRRHHIMNGKKDWDTYNSLMHLDKPNEDIVRMFSMIFRLGASRTTYDSTYFDPQIVILTGREERYRMITKDWIIKNISTHDNYKLSIDLDCKENSGYPSTLYMRKDGDYRPDEVIKPELLGQAKEDLDDNDVAFIVDDRNKVVKMWRYNGYTCLQCNEEYF